MKEKYLGEKTGRIIREQIYNFLDFARNNGNQTRELFNGFKQIAEGEKIKLLNEVNIMTPEHIHVNSFMYEPILDMDIVELHRLYQAIKRL